MYEFVLWMCLTTSPQCDIAHSVGHVVRIYPAESEADCDRQWKESLEEPDPNGMKSRYKCVPIKDDINYHNCPGGGGSGGNGVISLGSCITWRMPDWSGCLRDNHYSKATCRDMFAAPHFDIPATVSPHKLVPVAPIPGELSI